MTVRVQCSQCDNMILETTAKDNGGLCAPCVRKSKMRPLTEEDLTFHGKYDDASWHYGGTFPAELPEECGATHIGMFFSWCILNGLGSVEHLQSSLSDFEALKKEKITPGTYFIETCDGKFTDQDLSQVGNQFTASYYYPNNSRYLADYEGSIDPSGRLKTLYHAADSWESYKKIASVIQKRFDEFKEP